ncbi:hypothetical protein T492DRAFT_896848 [Pavlovales sp. CCMP2436]|nr:hypothetical protein T492DRAFT_896848 [Pavlovales sp. CCMP2436]
MNFIKKHADKEKVISARKEARVTDLFATLGMSAAKDLAKVDFFDISSIGHFATREKSAAWSPTTMFLTNDDDYYQHADSGRRWAAPQPCELWRALTA